MLIKCADGSKLIGIAKITRKKKKNKRKCRRLNIRQKLCVRFTLFKWKVIQNTHFK